MKVWNYVILSLGLALLFNFAGIPVADSLLTTFGIDRTGFDSSPANTIFLTIFAAGALVGIIIGALTRTTPENYLIMPLITGSLALFVSTFVGIVVYANSLTGLFSWVGYLVTLIMGVLGVGFIFALVEFFRGTD